MDKEQTSVAEQTIVAEQTPVHTPVAEQINIIMRQTDYDATTAEAKMTEHNNDVLKVIREYLNAGKDIKPEPVNRLSVNQQIYKEIRGMMDDAAKNYVAHNKL
jgi:hypothetical protein